MAAVRKHREYLISAALRLFRRQGYAATGLAEILQESGAPRGSLYHYFPDGKAEIAEAALRYAGEHLTGVLKKMAGASASPGEMVRAYGNLLAVSLEKSGYLDGCPVATMVLEVAPVSEKLTLAGADAFAAWAEVLAQMLERKGVGRARAVELADFTVGSLEGSLLLARARQSTVPVLRAAEQLSVLYEAEFSRLKESV